MLQQFLKATGFLCVYNLAAVNIANVMFADNGTVSFHAIAPSTRLIMRSSFRE